MRPTARTFSSFDGSEPDEPFRGDRITGQYRGGFLAVGGSNPEEGKTPFDTTPGPSDSQDPQRFWNLPVGEDIPEATI